MAVLAFLVASKEHLEDAALVQIGQHRRRCGHDARVAERSPLPMLVLLHARRCPHCQSQSMHQHLADKEKALRLLPSYEDGAREMLGPSF